MFCMLIVSNNGKVDNNNNEAQSGGSNNTKKKKSVTLSWNVREDCISYDILQNENTRFAVHTFEERCCCCCFLLLLFKLPQWKKCHRRCERNASCIVNATKWKRIRWWSAFCCHWTRWMCWEYCSRIDAGVGVGIVLYAIVNIIICSLQSFHVQGSRKLSCISNCESIVHAIRRIVYTKFLNACYW